MQQSALIEESGCAKRLKLVVVLDGKSGHSGTSSGLVRLISKAQPVEIYELRVKLRLKLFRLPLRLLINGMPIRFVNVFAPWIFELFYASKGGFPKEVDLVVSTGGDTSFANALVAMFHKTKNIFVGSLRGLDQDVFSLHINLHSNAGAGTLAMAVLPSRMNVLRAPGLPPRQWLCVIGGRSKHYPWTAQSVVAALNIVLCHAESYGAEVTFTTSPRTSKDVRDAVFEHLLGRKNLVNFFEFRASGAPTLEFLFEKSDLIACTEDSTSTLSDAVNANRPVISLRPEVSRPNEAQRQFICRLVRYGLVYRISVGFGQDGRELKRFIDAWRPPSPRLDHALAGRIDALLTHVHEKARDS